MRDASRRSKVLRSTPKDGVRRSSITPGPGPQSAFPQAAGNLAIQRRMRNVGPGPAHQSRANTLTAAGRGAAGEELPRPVRDRMEATFGTDFRDVRLHVYGP